MQTSKRFFAWLLVWCLSLSLVSFADVLDDGIYILDSGDIAINADTEEIPYNEGETDELQSNQDNSVSDASTISIQAETVLLANEAQNFAIDGAPLSGAWWLCSFDGYSDVYVYVPLSAANDSFSWNADGVPINITGSSITGYIGGQDYSQSIQFQPFSTPRYRPSSSSNYTYLSHFDVTESTINVYGTDNALNMLSDKTWTVIVAFVLILLLIVIIAGRFFN